MRFSVRRLALVGALLVVGCVTLPGDEGEEVYKDAVGYLSISTPTFTPITGVAQGDKALRFGSLRDEAELAKAVETPSLGVRNLSYEGLRAALKARYAGPSLSSSETQRSSAGSETLSSLGEGGVRSLTTDERRAKDEYERERTRTLQSPEAPEAIADGDYLNTPSEVERRMWALLERSDKDYALSPAIKASLVAAYKLQMVNMEEYYNLEGFSFGGRSSTEYLPYKMHFTVTAEPGWYTRYHPYDGVAELTIGSAEDYKILAAMPAEIAQTVDQLTASLRKLQLSLDLEGTYASAAARAQVQYVREAVERLEGLRVQNEMVVGFPQDNVIRMRFRPTSVPTDEGVDFQPVSRVVTALVLVKNTRTVNHEGVDLQAELELARERSEDVKRRFISAFEERILALRAEADARLARARGAEVAAKKREEALEGALGRARAGGLQLAERLKAVELAGAEATPANKAAREELKSQLDRARAAVSRFKVEFEEARSTLEAASEKVQRRAEDASLVQVAQGEATGLKQMVESQLDQLEKCASKARPPAPADPSVKERGDPEHSDTRYLSVVDASATLKISGGAPEASGIRDLASLLQAELLSVGAVVELLRLRRTDLAREPEDGKTSVAFASAREAIAALGSASKTVEWRPCERKDEPDRCTGRERVLAIALVEWFESQSLEQWSGARLQAALDAMVQQVSREARYAAQVNEALQLEVVRRLKADPRADVGSLQAMIRSLARAGFAGATAHALAATVRAFVKSKRLDRNRRCSVDVEAFFAPGLRDRFGSWSPPHAPFRCFSYPVERLGATANTAEENPWQRNAPVPFWPGPAIKPLKVQRAFGYYWGDYAEVTSAMHSLDQGLEALVKAEGERDKAKAAAATKTSEEKAAKANADQAFASWNEDRGNSAREANHRAAIAALTSAVAERKAAAAALALKETTVKGKQKAVDGLRKAHGKALVQAGKSGKGYVGFSLQSSPRWLTRDQIAEPVEVWVRVVAADQVASRRSSGPNTPAYNSAYDPAEFRRAGVGDFGGTIQIPRLNLGLAQPVAAQADYAKGTWKVVRVFMEAVLVGKGVEQLTVDERGEVLDAGSPLKPSVYQRTAVEVVLEPRAKVPGRAASPGAFNSGRQE